MAVITTYEWICLYHEMIRNHKQNIEEKVMIEELQKEIDLLELKIKKKQLEKQLKDMEDAVEQKHSPLTEALRDTNRRIVPLSPYKSPYEDFSLLPNRERKCQNKICYCTGVCRR